MPISRNPHFAWSARLAVFSAMIWAWRVQYISASDAAMSPFKSAAPTPFPRAL